ncbi:hypothetical protein F3K44_03095 [Bacillus megaterium]|nr:hypothetical protein [Priestia megaterium]
MQKIAIIAIILVFFTGCINQSKNQESKSSIKDEWNRKTVDLINKGKISNNVYFDYSSLLTQDTSLDDTWRYLESLKVLNIGLNKKTIDYLNNVEVENLQEKIKVNYLLSFFSVKERYEVNISSYLMGVINDNNMNSENKIEEIYYLAYFTNLDVQQKDKEALNKFLTETLQKNVPKDNNLIYEILFISHKIKIDYSKYFNKKIYKENFLDLVENKSNNIIDIYYLYFINKYLETKLVFKYDYLIKKFQTQDKGFSKSNKIIGDSITTFIILKILESESKTDLIDKGSLNKTINNNLNSNGGYNIGLNINPDNINTTSLLALLSLKYLKYDINTEEHYKYLLKGNTLNLREKYLGYMLIKEDITKKETQALKNDLNTAISQIGEAYNLNNNIVKKPDVIEAIYYLTIFQNDLDFELKDFNKITYITKEMIDFQVNNFKTTDSYLLMLAVEVAVKLDYTFEQSTIVKYIVTKYNNEKQIFIVNNRKDFLLNYSYIRILFSLEYKGEIDLKESLRKFKDVDAGYNTIVNHKETSSLTVTLLGLMLSDLINEH